MWQATALAVCLILAAALRVWAALGDFWQDEIWSWGFTRQMNCAADVITKIVHSNSHPTTTLYMYLIGDQPNWVWYRLLSIVTGTASVALLGYATLRRSFLEAITVVTLTGLSYPLILYSSEARGYAPAAFFSLASFFLIQGYWQRRTIWRLLPFWASVVLGVLSHLSFLYVYSSLVLWSLLHETRNEERRRFAHVALIHCHLIPVMFIAALYLIQIRYIIIGGGPVFTRSDVASRALLLAVGAPEKGALRLPGIAAACAAFIYGILILRKTRSYESVFMLSALLYVPAIVIFVGRPTFLYVRYFLVCFPFFYLVLARVLAGSYRRSNGGKVLYAVLLLLFIGGQSYRTSRLLSIGRGHYYDAVRYMAEQTTGTDIVVGSDFDFRNEMILGFYRRYLPPGKRMSYVKQHLWSNDRPDWVIVHSLDVDYEPAPDVVSAGGVRYALVRSFRYSGMSGSSWFLYRKVGNRRQHIEKDAANLRSPAEGIS